MPVSTKSWITKIDHSGVAITKNTISGRWPAASTSSVGPQVGAEREHRPGEGRRHAADEVTADDQPPRHPARDGHEAQERVGHVELGHAAEQHHRGDRHAVDADHGGREEAGREHPVGQPDGRGEAVREHERQAVAQRGRQAAAYRGLGDRGVVLVPDHRHGAEVNNACPPRSGALPRTRRCSPERNGVLPRSDGPLVASRDHAPKHRPDPDHPRRQPRQAARPAGDDAGEGARPPLRRRRLRRARDERGGRGGGGAGQGGPRRRHRRRARQGQLPDLRQGPARAASTPRRASG